MELEVNGHTVDPPKKRRISIHELMTYLDVQLTNDTIHVVVNGEEIARPDWLKQGAGDGDVVSVTFTS